MLSEMSSYSEYRNGGSYELIKINLISSKQVTHNCSMQLNMFLAWVAIKLMVVNSLVLNNVQIRHINKR